MLLCYGADKELVMRKLFYRFCHAPGYNVPWLFAMYISQWAHWCFLQNWITYEKYVKIQNWAYRVFDKE